MGSSEDELIGIPFPEHSSDLLHSLNEQRHRGILCDITIRTHGLEYRTHRAVLAACSHYFKKLFFSSSVEAAAVQRDVCELDVLKPDALGALLEFAYTATLTISNSSMRDVLQAARLLEIPCVVDACLEILQCSGGGTPDPADAGHQGDYQKAKQYLEELATERAADSPSQEKVPAAPLPEEPATVIFPRHRRRKAHRFLQMKPARPNNHILHSSMFLSRQLFCSPGTEESDCSPPQGPRDPSPPSVPSSENSQSYKVRAIENVTPAPTSPPENGSEEDPMELDPLTYLHPLHDSELTPSAEIPDNLGRKRRSQMPQECPVCHKIIHGAGKLPRHMRTHTGEKPFACQVCGVRFTRNDKLKIHMRKHTGERPYSCQHCSARFLHSYDLKNHMHLHTGDRPYECSLCHKAFAKEDHLQRHMKGQNCLEVRTRRRRKEEPAEVGYPHPTTVAEGLDLSNGKMEEFRLSMLRYWGLPRPTVEETSPEGVAAAEAL
ncbi:zinc finger and BTB domain-containing protein 7B [Microcaecilia unicolor]|uniref:Zinc finger and BTB domain-containing protein 7B-like n=1 Tax=Microcaecilia unicolor TaxID=1415580 RepID=A0A6P7WUF8_9AMPH|nr:zinc finger and BTB domain-containing protein 7B-like [Microcaecilia unicolor]